MKKISCYLAGFEPYGFFVGCMLEKSKEKKLLKEKNSVEFYNKVSDELDKFLELYDYNKANCEKWFSR